MKNSKQLKEEVMLLLVSNPEVMKEIFNITKQGDTTLSVGEIINKLAKNIVYFKYLAVTVCIF